MAHLLLFIDLLKNKDMKNKKEGRNKLVVPSSQEENLMRLEKLEQELS